MIRRLILTLLTLALFAAPAAAQDADAARREQLAQRLIEVSQGDNLTKSIETQVLAQLGQLEGGEPEHLAWMRANMPPLLQRMAEQMLPRLADLYAETFTIGELEAQITFYETPLGRGIANKGVALGMAQARITEEAGQAFVIDLLTKFCAEFDCGAGQAASKPATR